MRAANLSCYISSKSKLWALLISLALFYPITAAISEDAHSPEEPRVPTPTPTATATSTSRPPPTITPRPRVTPIPPPRDVSCDFHTIRITNEGDWGAALNVPMERYGGPGANSACQRRIWNQFLGAYRACYDPGIGGGMTMVGCHTPNGPCYDYRDECVVSFFFRSLRETIVRFEAAVAGWEYAPGRRYRPRWYLYPQSMYEPSQQRDAICLLPNCSWTANTSGTIYFDKQCRQIPGNPGGRECANRLRYRVSPVSLLWDDEVDVNRDVTITRFELVPGHEESWVQWKGSSKSPLLVYDPKHTGRITSGAQLFGDWTFGGKRKVSQVNPIAYSDMHPRTEPWPNGYEALSSLDFNRDGKISGVEAEPLALWFDENRDAISQKGEIKLLSDVGVTEIYFKGYLSEGNDRTLRLEKGYQRLVGGKKLVGKSVDWYTEIAQHPLQVQPGRPSTENSTAPRIPTAPGRFAPDASVEISKGKTPDGKAYALNVDPSVNVGGAWFWQITDGQDSDPSGRDGAFTLSDSNDGTIRGHTYGYMRFPKPIGESNELLEIVAIEGVKHRENGLTIQFSIPAREGDNYQIKSNAKLSPNGMVLEGVTTASFVENGKPMTSTYRWTAFRVTPEDAAAASSVAMN